MKIIYVENVRIPSERAHAYQIVQTCAWLARLGHRVTLVNPDRAGGQDVFAWHGLPPGLFHHERVRSWDPLSQWPVMKALAYALQRWAFVRALRIWARTQQADIWYTRDAAMIDALHDVVAGPWVLESHDTPDADATRWKRVKPRVAGHVAISQGMGDQLEKIGVAKEIIHIAPDGYEPGAFTDLPTRQEARHALGLPPDAFVALYAGSFYPWKGVDLVVRAWGNTPNHWHLVLIGGPEQDRARLQSLVPPECAKRVHILRAIPHSQMVRTYRIADVALLTSSPEYDIARQYTSPLKQFEYLAAGLPILASDVPSSHEVLTDTVARFFPPTPEGFLETLQAVEQDAEWRAQAADAGPQRVRPYSWESRARGIGEWLATLHKHTNHGSLSL